MSTPSNRMQMGGVPNMPDVSQAPPAWRGPTQQAFGLEALKPHMQDGAWSVFIACVAWAIHWQDIFDGKSLQVEGSLNLYAAPFVGMGDPNVWPIYQQFVSTVILTETQDWFENGNTYRKETSLVWPIIRKLAPALAQSSRGYSHRKAVKDILNGPMDVSFR